MTRMIAARRSHSRLDQTFPDYATLARPTPLQIEEAQTLLEPDEALVFWLPGQQLSHVFAVTRDKFAWKPLPISERAIADKVTALRRGLDLPNVQASIEAGDPALFDLALSHDLYSALLGPVEDIVKNKRHLIAVPSGPLTALPIHLLTTQEARIRPASLEDGAAYRDAAWLIKRHAVSLLPSVASLRSRRVVQRGSATKPFVGFGDPVFAPNLVSSTDGRSSVASLQPDGQKGSPAFLQLVQCRPGVEPRDYSEFWLGNTVDRDRLAQALPPIPDSADELKAVARNLGAAATEIHLGPDASEATVKRASLADYRVIYFSTHGVISGDPNRVGEPFVALTLPDHPDDLDDGTLTASEVAQLKLNADWVVLTAASTASGPTPAADGLSGFARAVLYAGARSMLLSHWTVAQPSATRLTTSLFAIEKTRPTLGRAEALRRAMLAYLSDPAAPHHAYPAFWGPFSIVGEGAAR